MIRRSAVALIAFVSITACGAGDESAPPEDLATDSGVAADGLAMDGAPILTDCAPQTGNMPVEGRESPYDSTMVVLGDAQAKVCYGRPAVRGREIFGGLVPYDTIWRTGANEPTTIHLPVAAEIAGIALEPGSYSLYTVPGQEAWTVIVNRSTDQWGIESRYTEAVRNEEVGRAPVAAEALPALQETFEISSVETGAGAADLVLAWERTRVTIPVRRL